MKHFTLIEIGGDSDSPMIGTIDNIPNTKIGITSFEERFFLAVAEHFDIDTFECNDIDLNEIFISYYPYIDVTVKFDGICCTVRVLETWHY